MAKTKKGGKIQRLPRFDGFCMYWNLVALFKQKVLGLGQSVWNPGYFV